MKEYREISGNEQIVLNSNRSRITSLTNHLNMMRVDDVERMDKTLTELQTVIRNTRANIKTLELR